jgi:hypothetical protein
MRRAGSIAALAGLLCLSGCPRAPDRDPLATALRYLDAAVAGDVETCYALLSDEAKQGCDRACVASVIERQRSELRMARDELRASLREKNGRETVTRTDSHIVSLRDGSELRLGRAPQPLSAAGKGAGPAADYRFTQSPLLFYPQDTPERALRSFLLAVDRGRWDVLLDFMPRSVAQPAGAPPYTAEQLQQRFLGPLRQDLARQLAALRQHIGDGIQIAPSGAEAKLPVGEGRQARLVLEDGAWRISQLE